MSEPSIPRTLTVAEAAAELGITIDAVRHRLRRGKLTGHKDGDDHWLVDLAAGPTPVAGPSTPPASEPTPDLRRDVDALTATLADVRGQLIRAETERDAAIAERDRLWQMLSGTLGRLLPAAGETVSAPTPPTERRWWQVWR